MTVAQFIEWLKTQDQSATICVLETCSTREGGFFDVFRPERHAYAETHSTGGPYLELGRDNS